MTRWDTTALGHYGTIWDTHWDMLGRYWDTRRDLAERQRLLDSMRVDNISSVTHGHLIDRLPQQAV